MKKLKEWLGLPDDEALQWLVIGALTIGVMLALCLMTALPSWWSPDGWLEGDKDGNIGFTLALAPIFASLFVALVLVVVNLIKNK